MSPAYVHVAVTLALIESFGLGMLLMRLHGLPGLRLLIAFLIGVGIWGLSCLLPVWFGPSLDRLAAALVAFSSLTSAVFFHFVLVLCGRGARRRWVLAGYLLGGGATVLALGLSPGRYAPWNGFESFFVPNAIGWTVGIAWSVLAVSGHAVLFWHWWQRRGPPRGQLVAMCLASGWGAVCMAGYGFHAMGIERYPYPLLFLPLYPLILVYGILRYQLMVVNAWARRTLAWTLLVGLGSAAVIGVAALPLPFSESLAGWRLWVTVVGTLLVAGLLLDPLRRLATRLIYPGSQLADDAVERWRAELSPARSYEQLAAAAATAISSQLRVSLDVAVIASDLRSAAPRVPTLECRRGRGRWHTELVAWDAAPPGPRYVAQLFGVTLAETAAQLEHSMAFAERERERQQQERLAELGALAATVAHDIRNPLNIIAMATATAAADIRAEVAIQTSRISQLASDLLDYAKSWQVDKQPLDLADYVRVTTARYVEIETGDGLVEGIRIDADSRRLSQALLNLLENARAAVVDQQPGRILVDAARGADGSVELAVCDNGTGIPEEILHSLFQPFVSRRPDGTGLGLAIVSKIMQAHGGSARLGLRAGWTTCFVLSFPAAPPP